MTNALERTPLLQRVCVCVCAGRWADEEERWAADGWERKLLLRHQLNKQCQRD